MTDHTSDELDLLRAQLATVTAERDKANADYEAACENLRASIRVQITSAIADYNTKFAAAHRAGCQQTIERLRDTQRYLDWWASTCREPGSPTREHLSAYLTDTYKPPA